MRRRRRLLGGLALLVLQPALAQADSYGHVQNATKSEGVIAAETHMAAGEWAKAIPYLEARNAGYPDEVETVADLGHCYAMVGDLDQAIDKLKVAVDLDPRHLEARLYLGEAYLARKELAPAEEQLKALDGICIFGCGAYRQLKGEIAAFKAGAKP